MSTQPVVAPHSTHDFMPLHGIDHVELWVGNATQAAYFYTRAFGFREVAYAGLETGRRDRTSHVLQQGRIRLVLTGTLTSNHEIALHHARHGDGVKVIALSVPDAAYAYRRRRRARRDRRARAVGGGRRARHRPDVDDRRLRRDAPHLRRAQGLHRARSSPATSRARTARPTPAC